MCPLCGPSPPGNPRLLNPQGARPALDERAQLLQEGRSSTGCPEMAQAGPLREGWASGMGAGAGSAPGAF